MREISPETTLDKPLCLAMGFFDSVHIGHRKLIERTLERAGECGGYAGIITFSNNAYRQFNPSAKEIYTYAERLQILNKLGLEVVLPFHFGKAMKALAREDFLHALERLPIRSFVCGYDYLFGHNGEGNADFLQEYAVKKGVMCDVLPPVMLGGERVSSSLIKRLLSDGKITAANLYLGGRYFMSGEVVTGRGVGRQFGFPTANLSYSKEKLLVREGVYATFCTVDDKRYKSVTNVGAKPTFDVPSVTVESFIGGCDGDLYGKTLTVEFVDYLRPVRKFASPDELRSQIYLDMEWKTEDD